MNTQSNHKRVMIIAGEASGDLHGAKLVRAMKDRDPDLEVAGIGGSAMRQAGARIVVDAATIAVVGITEVLSKGRSLLRGMAAAKNLLKTLNPDLLILIDFPDFNLHMAAKAKKLGIPVLYFISPQIWAWRRGRIKKIKKRVDHMAVILPFEEAFYRQHGVPVTFVGHPLLDDRRLSNGGTDPKDPDKAPLIGLLPGSRDKEVSRHLPVMLQAAEQLSRSMDNPCFVVSRAPSVDSSLFEKIMSESDLPARLQVTTEHVSRIFSRSRVVVAVSGTVTLEAALSGTPTVIIYRVSPLSYWMGRALIQVEHIGLVNLIAEKGVVPELIQQEVTPDNIAEHVRRMLDDPRALQKTVEELMAAQSRLGGPGASERVARLAFDMMNAHNAAQASCRT